MSESECGVDITQKVSGTKIDQLIQWNNYLDRIRINEKPLIPFSNQLMFLRCNELEVLYGGGTRGGKSVALLIAALQYAHISGYNAIIFRRSYRELSKGDGLIPLSKMWLKPFEEEGLRWNADDMQWEFPTGAIIGFGHLDSENDKYKYIGQSYQFIGFDELTQQPEETYSFLFSRLVRNKDQESMGIPLRMRCTTNPNGEHVEWVYNRFVNKRTRPALREQIVVRGMEKLKTTRDQIPESYIKHRMPKFIPSLARDNPFLDVVSYMDSLDNMDPVRRAQLAEGNWEIRAMGNMFSRAWFEKVPYAKVPVIDLKKVRYWDMAATVDGDATATCHLGYDKKSGIFYILDMKLLHKTPYDIEKEVHQCAILDGPSTAIYMEKEPGSAGSFNIENFKRRIIPPGHRFYEDRVSGPKEERARPVSAAAEKEILKIAWSRSCEQWFDQVMEQLEMFPEAEHDDSVDALSGAFNVLNHKLNHTATYVGKMDWLLPADGYINTAYGPRNETQILNVVRNPKK